MVSYPSQMGEVKKETSGSSTLLGDESRREQEHGCEKQETSERVYDDDLRDPSAMVRVELPEP